MSKQLAYALTCSGVSKTFPVYDEGAHWRILLGRKGNEKVINALSDVSLSVPKGQFVGVLGRNGAGKSTLLRTLGGVYAPNKGTVSINGRLSSLFELGGFGNRFITGREYAIRVLQLQGVKRKALPHLIKGIIEFSELDNYFDSSLFSYSSGMAARLYFATATALQYDVYLIDEILSVGDEHFQGKCWHRLRERFTQGASGVLVTHDWSAVIKLCAEAHIMDHGKIIQSGRADKIVQSYLQLPLPPRNTARFIDEDLSCITVKANETAKIPIKIELVTEEVVNFLFTIEMLQLGEGWEILVLQDCGIVATEKGTYTITVEIPQLPITAGKYTLNLFLNRPATNEQPKIGLDIKSWTVGNGIDLIVEGEENNALFNLPLQWSEAAHVS